MSTYKGPTSDHKRTLSRAEKNARKVARADRRHEKAERASRAREIPEGYQMVRVRVSGSLERANRLRYGQKRWWIIDVDADNPDSETGKGLFVDVEAVTGRKAWLWQSLDVTIPMRPGAHYIIGSGATVRVSVEITSETTEITIDAEQERAHLRETETSEPGSDADLQPSEPSEQPSDPIADAWLPLLTALGGNATALLGILQHAHMHGCHPYQSAAELHGIVILPPSAPSEPVPF